MKALYRIVTAVALAVAAAPAPAHATHFMTVCDSGDSGIPILGPTPPIPVLGGDVTVFVGTGEAWIKNEGGTLGDFLVGVDVGADRGAVCVRTGFTGNRHVVYGTRTFPGWLGMLVSLQACDWNGEPGHSGSTQNCQGLAATGVIVDPATFTTCVYLNGNLLIGPPGFCPVL